MGVPLKSSNFSGIFHNKNHPFFGYLHIRAMLQPLDGEGFLTNILPLWDCQFLHFVKEHAVDKKQTIGGSTVVIYIHKRPKTQDIGMTK